MANDRSQQCQEVLRLLAVSRNVLVTGPPGTGKSRVLSEVASAFAEGVETGSIGTAPVHVPGAAIPIPPATTASPEAVSSFPAAAKTSRAVFRTVFHQNSKHRDFVTGIVPNVNVATGANGFRIVEGTLYRASEHAKTANGAALLIIDEINRGPAVQVFGGAIVAMEADKRLGSDNAATLYTQVFELMQPGTGNMVEYALPEDLFILAAMNQADASVEPLDVAFLRRWEPFKLEPSESALRGYYGLGAATDAVLPAQPTTADAVFEASTRAWASINHRIGLGRGREFQIGHGVLMSLPVAHGLSLSEALSLVQTGWAKILAHVEEVFFGDLGSTAAALNAKEAGGTSAFSLAEYTFADEIRYSLDGPRSLTSENIYDVLRSIA